MTSPERGSPNHLNDNGDPAPGRRRPPGRILFSLLLLLFGVGVVPLLWTSYTLVTRSRDVLELNQRTLQLDKARSLSQQVAAYVTSLESQVAAIARTLEIDMGPVGARILRIQETKALERYVSEQNALPLYYLSVVDTTCTGTFAGIHLNESAIDVLLRAGCDRAREGKRLAAHQSVMSTSFREPLVVIAEPVKPGTSGVQGAVVAVAGLGPLWTMARDVAQFSQSGKAQSIYEVYVVDSRGHLVAHSDLSQLGDTDLAGVEIVRFFLESGRRFSSTETFRIPSPRGPVEMLGTYAPVPNGSGWGVIVQVSKAKAYFEATAMRDRSLLLVAIVTVLAVLFGTLFAGQISQPIRALARGAQRLASGHYDTRVNVRSRNEVGFLAEAFNHMGEEIQKAIEQIRHAAIVNKELFVGSIRMLANAIDEKDPYTRGHSDRVAYYSRVIAKHMGLPDEEVERTYLAGILHDVGKIGIEDKILRKATALTDEEYAIMKQHPRKGAHILAAVPTLKEMTGDGLMHHENVDGTGYPEGLKGPAIPLLGRIVSVADAFDAMTTDRPYSKAMTFEAALDRLRFLAGKKFDPDCVTGMEKASAAGDLTPEKAHQATQEAHKPQESAAAP